MTPNSWLIYGTGTIAKALAFELCRIGYQPIIAGGDEKAVLALAESVQCPYRIFTATRSYVLEQELQDVDIVLDASETKAAPSNMLIEACLKSHCHYVALQPWPTQAANAKQWHEQAIANGLVLIFASGFLSQALALWQANESLRPEYFVVDDKNAYLLPIVGNSVTNKTPKGVRLSETPVIYWQAGRKTAGLLLWAKAKTWLLNSLQKNQASIINSASAVFEISAFVNDTKQKTLLVSTQKMQRLQIKTAVFLLESLLACKSLPGVYSAYEVVDNNPEQTHEFLDSIFTELRANTDD